ncbi:MAG: HAMP domain-containing protein, partial [Lachnospiraceae bacterium]|nr:HAMP domain-containing protein [Lachnospiraceae bacterium]
MRQKIRFYHKVNVQILSVLVVFILITAIFVSLLNRNNIRRLYEESFSERVLLSNVLISKIINPDSIENYVNILRAEDDEFKQRQLKFHLEREALFALQEAGVSGQEQEALLNSLAAFHESMAAYKDDEYWTTLDELKELKELSHSSFVYVMADTGLRSESGDVLYTYIYDAKDTGIYDSPDVDGLGTLTIGEEVLNEIYATKKPMDEVAYYSGGYGELYFAYAPILNSDGEVIAILGTDIDLDSMRSEMTRSAALFNFVIFGSLAMIILVIYLYLKRLVITPMLSLTQTARELADGNIYAPTLASALKQKGEIGTLAHAVNDMSVVYQNMIKSVDELFSAAIVGRLDVRNDASLFKGDIRKVITQINDTLDATVLYLNSIPESVFIMNKDYEVYFRNQRFFEWFGDMSGRYFLEHLCDTCDTAENLDELTASLMNNPNSSATMWINDICLSVMIKDITLNRPGDNSILVIAVEITDLMEEKDKAQEAASAKSNFLSRMSHEMRTPMNAIIGMTKIAENTDDLSKLRYCLSTIGTSADHLLCLINDVLDMAKIEAGKFEFENLPMNIEKMLQKVSNITIGSMENKHQRFAVILERAMSLNYIADDLRLSQVITNLLSNATKFTPEGGRITLTVETIAPQNAPAEMLAQQSEPVETLAPQNQLAVLRFTVRDTGIGMTDEQSARLFNAFEQSNGGITRKYGGTGLGLAISKSIIEKMGGTIWVESALGSGSSFIFEVGLTPTTAQNPLIFDRTALEHRRILIAGPDEVVRERLKSITDELGIPSDTVAGITEVDVLLESTTYDLIFIDYELTDFSTSETIDRIGRYIDKKAVIIM